MDLNQRLWDLWQIPEEDRTPAVKVLQTLYGNILKDPNNPKFRDLNFSKIRRKFDKARPAFYLLFTAGFSQNVDGSRLVFALQQMKMLQAANEGLLAKIANPDDPKLLPKSQKPKESEVAKSSIKDKHFKEKFASSSVEKHEREEREEKEKQKELESAAAAENDKNNENGDDNDIDMENNENKAEQVEDTRTEEEKEAENKEIKNALAGLDQDDMDLLAQIQASKDTTVQLSMAELVGKTKEEKIALFKEKQKQFRKEKARATTRAEIEKERKRRDNVKMAQEAKLKREDQQRAMLAAKKKREKQEEKMRKQRIRDKIKADKERKKREKEIAEKKKQYEQQQQQSQNNNNNNNSNNQYVD